jgi:hypothetical protein
MSSKDGEQEHEVCEHQSGRKKKKEKRKKKNIIE